MKDEKVLQSVFQKPVKKAFFNENERSKLQAVAEDYKRLRKIKGDLKGKPKTINKKSRSTPRPTSELRPSPPAFTPGNRGDYNNGKHRLSTKPGGIEDAKEREFPISTKSCLDPSRTRVFWGIMCG